MKAVEIWILGLASVLVTVVLVLWRPGGMHAAVPALIGAFLLFLIGLVDRQDVLQVMIVVWNSAMTIISTFIMASVLEGAGFFYWVGNRLIDRANGSGKRLFHLVLAFSSFLTLFLNNDGSILLGTPVVIGLVKQLRLARLAAFAYLISVCLIATAVSPSVGVNNMANLETLALVGTSLAERLRAVMIPALIGLGTCWFLLYAIFRKVIPADLTASAASSAVVLRPPVPLPHPQAPRGRHLSGPDRWPWARHRHHALPSPSIHHQPPSPDPERSEPDLAFMWFTVGVVVLVRLGSLVASLLGVPTYAVAVTGAGILLVENLHHRVVNTRLAIQRAPWAILAFVFGMNLVVFGLRNAGITEFLAEWLGPAIRTSLVAASVLPGTLVAWASALLNNHPGLIIGSLTLSEIEGLAGSTLHVAYSGVVLGSSLGALLTPMGTVASLLWFHLLRQHGHTYGWWEYTMATLAVIPASFAAALLTLYGISVLSGL